MSLVGPPAVLPLLLLLAILGLPALLIAVTTGKLVYIYWMAIYLCSLPVWNLILPLYAFWHFGKSYRLFIGSFPHLLS